MEPSLKITQDEIVDRQTLLHIELEDEDTAPYIDRGYRRLVQRVTIPGFRKGKAPRSVVENYFGRESLLRESLDQMVSEVTRRAIEEQELETAGRPSIELLELEPVTVEAKVALTPTVDLGPYKELRVPEEPVETSEEDVQERLEELRKGIAPWEPVERPLQLGDMVTLTALGTVDGQTMLDQKGSVIVAEPGSVVPLPGFAERLVGTEVGVEREFDLPVRDDHADTSLAGKTVHFTLTASDIKERNLPEMDDEFAKSVGDDYESLEALRDKVKEEVEEEASKAQTTQYREAALEELVKLVTVDLPPLLVEHEVEHMVDRRDQFVERLNIRKDDYLRYTGKTEDEIQEEMTEQATERLSRSYALATLAEQEGLEVSDEDIDAEVKRLAESGMDAAAGHNLDSPEVRSSVRETLLVEKAINRLTAIAKDEVDGSSETDDQNEEEEPEEGGDRVDATT